MHPTGWQPDAKTPALYEPRALEQPSPRAAHVRKGRAFRESSKENLGNTAVTWLYSGQLFHEMLSSDSGLLSTFAG
jgi:hypothetical protein